MTTGTIHQDRHEEYAVYQDGHNTLQSADRNEAEGFFLECCRAAASHIDVQLVHVVNHVKYIRGWVGGTGSTGFRTGIDRLKCENVLAERIRFNRDSDRP